MRFGEAVFTESANLREDPLRELLVQSVGFHSSDEFALKLVDHTGSSPSRHRTSELVRFPWREPGRDDCQAHRLLLKNRDSHRLAQNGSDLFARILRLNATASGRQIRMNHISLDGTGPNDRDFDDQIIEATGLEPRQHTHLRPTLDLKDPHGVGCADHVVNSSVRGGNGRQGQRLVVVRFDQIQTSVNRGKHAEGQAINLEDPQFV